MSRSMPSLAFFERYAEALPTNTGAPGTVENTVSASVVVAPVAFLYGSSSAYAGVAQLDRAVAALHGEL